MHSFYTFEYFPLCRPEELIEFEQLLVTESVGEVYFEVRRDGGSMGEVSVDFTTLSNSARATPGEHLFVTTVSRVRNYAYTLCNSPNASEKKSCNIFLKVFHQV